MSTKLLDSTVFPSDEKTIMVHDDDIYGGAHNYTIKNCLGFNDGKTQYDNDGSEQVINFVRKTDDGKIVPGLQSEQLVHVILDRCRKLNARFPSAQNEKMITGLEMFLDACRERVQDRLDRGVMGELKK